jgi:galactitol-specific phosphotransferase system IIC component
LPLILLPLLINLSLAAAAAAVVDRSSLQLSIDLSAPAVDRSISFAAAAVGRSILLLLLLLLLRIQSSSLLSIDLSLAADVDRACRSIDLSCRRCRSIYLLLLPTNLTPSAAAAVDRSLCSLLPVDTPWIDVSAVRFSVDKINKLPYS